MVGGGATCSGCEEVVGEPEGVRLLDSFFRDMSELDGLAHLDQSSLQRSSADSRLALKSVGSRPAEPIKKRKTTRMVGPVLPKAPTNKTPPWLRRKQELAALRQQIQAMETRVAFLQLQRERAGPSQAPHKWEAAVLTEQQRLKAAQDENEELRFRLRAFGELSRQLQAAISSAMSPTTVFACTCTNVPPQLDTSAGSFDMLESRLESQFKDVQVILDGFEPPVDGVHVEMLDGDAANGPAMEYRLAQTLPFDAMMASKAIWHLVEMDCPPPTQFTQIIRQSESLSAVQSRCILSLDEGGLLIADTRAVMKRFVASEGCVVFVHSDTMWSAYHENEPLWSHATKESIRVLVRRSLRPVGCHMNALLRSEAVQQHIPSGVGTFVDSRSTHAIVMAHCREIIASRRQFLENVIWDSVRADDKKR